jgi:hypothetical protein
MKSEKKNQLKKDKKPESTSLTRDLSHKTVITQ